LESPFVRDLSEGDFRVAPQHILLTGPSFHTLYRVDINFLLKLRAIMRKRAVLILCLLAVLYGCAYASNDQWIEVRSAHFAVITNSSEKQGRVIVDQFERMRWMFQALYPKAQVDPDAPIVIVAAKNGKTFQAMEPAAYLAKGQLQLGGLFLRAPDKNYILLREDSEQEHPFAAVYHEYTHLQFNDDHDWMPLWLNEGLAEFFQNTEIRNKDVLVGEPSVDDILYLRQNRLIPMPVLFAVDSRSPYYHEEQKGSVFYAESWALTHFLFITDKQKGSDRVGDYMRLLIRHEDPMTAAQKAFGDLKLLQKNLESYIQASSYKQFVLSSAAAPIDESSYKVRALTQNDADAVRADVLAYVGRTEEAKSLLAAVLKADPNNTLAHETMGFLEFRQGNVLAARKWLGEAIQLSSQSYLAYYYFATMLFGQDNVIGNKEIEDDLRVAIRLNPRFFPSSDQLASLLESQDRAADATTVLMDSLQAKLKPADAARARQRIAQIKQMQDARIHATVKPDTTMDSNVVSTVVDIVPESKHPTEAPNGPKHWADGVISHVQCGYPAEIEFQIEGAKKTVSVYSNNYSKLDITAMNFTPTGALHLCDELQGMKARVEYAESTDKTVDGQVVAIQLRK
jgi:tetratricopeptide (TPR) repeat protein